MSFSNGIISDTGVSIADVKSALGVYSTRPEDSGIKSLCRSSNINIWSKYKPISYPLISAGNTAELWKRTCKDKNYGLGLPSATKSVTTAAGRSLAYDRPTGVASSPYRLGDFRGYYRDAKAPIRGVNGKDVTFDTRAVADGAGIWNMTFPKNSAHSNTVSLEDGLSFLSGKYLGVVLVDSRGVIQYALSADSSIGSDKWNIIHFRPESGPWNATGGSTSAMTYTYYAVVFDRFFGYDDAQGVNSIYFHCHLFQSNSEATGTFTAIPMNVNFAVDVERYMTYSVNSAFVDWRDYEEAVDGAQNSYRIANTTGTMYFAIKARSTSGAMRIEASKIKVSANPTLAGSPSQGTGRTDSKNISILSCTYSNGTISNVNTTSPLTHIDVSTGGTWFVIRVSNLQSLIGTTQFSFSGKSCISNIGFYYDESTVSFTRFRVALNS